jgi:hypothetical protein
MCIEKLWIGVDYPQSQVGSALAPRLWHHPQLKVLRMVVVADAVLVMNILKVSEWPTEDPLHDQPVL